MIINANKQEIWFSSDIHAFHKNIIEYCKRPYENVYQMNKDIQETCNNMIKNNLFFNLGDTGMASPEMLKEYYSGFTSKQVLVSGNHDRKGILNSLSDIFFPIFKDKTILHVTYNENLYTLYLSHKPDAWEYIDDEYSIFLYGHLHEKEIEDKRWNQMNIGWDRFYMPIEFKEIIYIIKKNYEDNKDSETT